MSYRNFTELTNSYVKQARGSEHNTSRLIETYLKMLSLKLPDDTDLLPEWYDLLAIKKALDQLYEQANDLMKEQIRLANIDFEKQLLDTGQSFRNKLTDLQTKK